MAAAIGGYSGGKSGYATAGQGGYGRAASYGAGAQSRGQYGAGSRSYAGGPAAGTAYKTQTYGPRSPQNQYHSRALPYQNTRPQSAPSYLEGLMKQSSKPPSYRAPTNQRGGQNEDIKQKDEEHKCPYCGEFSLFGMVCPLCMMKK